MKNSRKNPLFRQILAATLLVSGASQLIAPVLAQTAPLTSAGTSISNTGTATYQDPNDPANQDADPNNNVNINATSNTVTITVAEVAGITVTSGGINDPNGGSVSTDDALEFNYLVTNVGNDTTNIFIPGASNIATTGLNGTTLVVTADLNNDGTFETTVPAAGFTTTTPVTPGSSIRVRVTGTVTAIAAGDIVSVRFGNTGANDNSAGTQNQPDDGLEGAAVGTDPVAGSDEVRTVDAPDNPPSEAAGPPVNGVREASSSQSTTLATAITTRALATVLKTRSAYNPQTAGTNNDLITYRLDLRVESSSPNPSFTPGTLEGTIITLDGTTQTRILVSDSIPAGTALDPTFNPTATVPAGWTVVYSLVAGTGNPDNALTAQWLTYDPLNPPTPANVKRIGFVFTGTTLAPGSTTTTSPNGFQFRVVTSGLPAGGNVSNLAQSFGETLGDAANTVNYDESGDNRPNNFNDDNTNDPTTNPTGAGGFNPNVDNGVADPATQGTDASNNNTGTGPDGEVNVLAIAPPGSIFNGPLNQPGATGPGGSNQNDFTNKSATNLPNSQGIFDPAPVTFNNTVNNPGSSTLNNVVLRPIAPSQADFVADGTAGNQTDRNTGFGTDAAIDLPNNTTVTIDPDGAGPLTATYTWNGTTFNLTSGANIVLASLGATSSLTYTVTVDLPGSTPQTQAFPVPIVSFVDTDGDGIFDRTTTTPTVEPIFNLTINREYTGYVSLVKTVQILDTNGTSIVEAFTQTPAVRPSPGQFLVYRITYNNISTPPSAGISGSVLLNASNLAINEDGAAAPNNWAGFTTHQQATVTSPTTPVQFFNGATSLGATDPATGTAVTRYLNNVGTVAPSGTGTFTFQRRVN